MIKNLPANASDSRDPGSIPGLGRSPGEENGSQLQYSCLDRQNSMDRGAWLATVLGVAESATTECASINMFKLETCNQNFQPSKKRRNNLGAKALSSYEVRDFPDKPKWAHSVL